MGSSGRHHRGARWYHRLLCTRWPARAAVFGAVLALGGATGCASTATKAKPDKNGETPADKHYKVAVGSFHNGLLSDAKIQLERALEMEPEHASSHYLQGVILLHEGQTMVNSVEMDRCLLDEAADQQRRRAERLHKSAHEAFSKAASIYRDGEPGRGRAYNSMAVVSLFFHDHDAAIEEAKQALRSQFYTERYSALANLGWAYYGKGDLIEAMTELREAVLLNPDFCVGHYRLAQVYLDYDRSEQALEEASTVIGAARCPIQDAHRIAGVANLRLGNDAEASQRFTACIDLAPRSCLATDCQQFLASAAG